MSALVIPARGGSKRIPNKNIRPFFGKPMIAWSIEAALRSRCFDRVIVSTDSAEVAAVAQRWGAEIPFMRPAELSDDHTGIRDVIRHARLWLQANDTSDHTLMGTLLATSPFISAQRIIDSVRLLETCDKQRAFLVCAFGYPVQRGFHLSDDGSPEMLFREHLKTRSQDLDPIYHDAGQLYLSKLRGNASDDAPYLGEGSLPIVLPGHLVQDIDTEEDWVRAELMMRILLETGELQ